MDRQHRAVRPDASDIARSLEIDGQYVAHVDPVREQVVAVRRAAHAAAKLAGRRITITTTRPGQLRWRKVSVIVEDLDLDAEDRDRLTDRATMLADELDRRERQD